MSRTTPRRHHHHHHHRDRRGRARFAPDRLGPYGDLVHRIWWHTPDLAAALPDATATEQAAHAAADTAARAVELAPHHLAGRVSSHLGTWDTTRIATVIVALTRSHPNLTGAQLTELTWRALAGAHPTGLVTGRCTPDQYRHIITAAATAAASADRATGPVAGNR